MKVNSAINHLVIDMLKNILSMADKPAELGKYITSQIRELIGCKSVILLYHNEINQNQHHQIIGICPERKAVEFNQKKWNEIAEFSHSFHEPTLFQHKISGNKIEQLLSKIDGEYSIIIPLEITGQRIGMLCVIDISEIQNQQSIIDSLDALSGVLAIELRNAMFIQNMETIVAQRTKELSESEKRFRTIIEQATDAMYLSDMDGNIIDTNKRACESLGYTYEELLKLKVTDLDANYDETHKMNESFKKMNPNENFTFESVHRRRNGDTFPVEISTSLIDLHGVQNVIGFVRDITDRKFVEEEVKKLNKELELKVIDRTIELEKRSFELLENEAALLNLVEDLNLKSDELQNSKQLLEATNKELEAFSYSVSHDLRAPLRAINGFVNILNDEYDHVLDDEGKRICSIINSNAVKMGQLIDDLHSFSRLIKSELHHSTIDMQNIVRELISEFQISKELNPNIIVLKELPQSIGDTNLIKQVWMNLISNAIKYSSKTINPQIIIGATQNENETIYFIKDNGVGFNMNYSHKLFGVFQRLHGANEFEGTGVGLAIVQRIVSRHGGRVWAEGEIDKGATFYFTLPIKNVEN